MNSATAIFDAMTALKKQMKKEQKAEAKREAKLAKIKAALAAQQKFYRENPKALAAAIAAQIRADDRPNEDPNDYEANGGGHWYQAAWGNVRVEPGAIKPLESPITSSRYGSDAKYFEVTCPTTGCVAGWAASMAGFPMVFNTYMGDTVEELYEEAEGDVMQIDHCYDPIFKQIRPIADVGAQNLNLGDYEREWLFSSGRSKNQVLWALDKIAEDGFFIADHAPRWECGKDGCTCSTDHYCGDDD